MTSAVPTARRDKDEVFLGVILNTSRLLSLGPVVSLTFTKAEVPALSQAEVPALSHAEVLLPGIVGKVYHILQPLVNNLEHVRKPHILKSRDERGFPDML